MANLNPSRMENFIQIKNLKCFLKIYFTTNVSINILLYDSFSLMLKLELLYENLKGQIIGHKPPFGITEYSTLNHIVLALTDGMWEEEVTMCIK
jgi:hypothetical protein